MTGGETIVDEVKETKTVKETEKVTEEDAEDESEEEEKTTTGGTVKPVK